jgi:hypothetical protein
VGGEEVGRCSVIHGGIPKDPTVGEECWKSNLDTAVGEGARSLDRVAARSLSEMVADMWMAHRL